VWKSTKRSIKIGWNHKKIQEFAQKLEVFRSALTLSTILALRAGSKQQHAQLEGQLRSLHATAEDQNCQSLLSFEGLQYIIKENQIFSERKLDSLDALVRDCLDNLKSVKEKLPLAKERAILRWLNFRQMTHRLEEVPTAFRTTFEWVFHKSLEDCPWDSFITYLEDSGCSAPYWINGKAGSGKSSLMKFIVNDERTKQALMKWSGNDELLMPTFFFWNLGTALQNSHVGLIRSLLHAVLEAHEELIPVVFPVLWHNWKPSDEDVEPSYIEVKKAFELLLGRSSSFLKLCIFVDGIDEYNGDHKDMSLFLRSLTSTHVKVVVSSRPITACVNAFQHCPTLRLQDLTRGDMEIYVRENLCTHQSMVALANQHPQRVTSLVGEIRSKANGVFLWVSIVVRLLIEGLEAGDDMHDLKHKLRLLPADLRDLYRRMMFKMQPEYQVQAAEMFQLLHTWNAMVPEQPLKTIVFSFALEDPSKALQLPVGPLEAENALERYHKTEARVRSRCCGLIEVHKKFSRKDSGLHQPLYGGAVKASWGFPLPDIENVMDSTIEYLHRTVAEFLHSDNVWNEICGMTTRTGFDAMACLAYACLAMLKVQPGHYQKPTISYLNSLMAFCRSVADISDQSLLELVSCTDRTMRHHQQNTEPLCLYPSSSMHWSADLYLVQCVDHHNSPTQIRQHASIITFATRNGLLRYLKLLAHNDRPPSALSNILILHALESWRDHLMKPYLNQRTDTLQFVLQNASGLGNGSSWKSIWEYGMIVADDLQNRGMPLDCAELLKVLLLAGQSRAPLGTSKVRKPSKPQETIDPLELVRQLKNYKSPRGKDVTPLSYTALQEIKLHDEQVKQLGSDLELLALAYDASYEPFSHTFEVNTETRFRKYSSQSQESYLEAQPTQGGPHSGQWVCPISDAGDQPVLLAPKYSASAFLQGSTQAVNYIQSPGFNAYSRMNWNGNSNGASFNSRAGMPSIDGFDMRSFIQSLPDQADAQYGTAATFSPPVLPNLPCFQLPQKRPRLVIRPPPE
jgi:hypothetical protein